jgi:hypothetical protein
VERNMPVAAIPSALGATTIGASPLTTNTISNAGSSLQSTTLAPLFQQMQAQ